MTESLHSDCGPSSLERRILCPGSRNAERGLPDRPSSYAAEGTVFHEVVSMCLEFGLEPDDFLDKEFEADGFTFTFDESFARHMRPALDRAREIIAGCDVYGFENRVDISHFTEKGQFGTTDLWGINVAKNTLHIHDWKYGEGVGVEAEENWQAIAYAAGVWNSIGWKYLLDYHDVTVKIVLDQMRRPEGGGEWITTMQEINSKYLPQIKSAIALSSDPDAPRIAGLKQCFFCKARGRCAALAAFNMEQAVMKFEELDHFDPVNEDIERKIAPPETRDLTPMEISRIIQNAPLWSMWMRSVHEVAFERVMLGMSLPGLKAVPGRAGHRFWINETAAERFLQKKLGDRAFARKLVSPAQAEKLLGAEDTTDISVLWDQRETKPSLVPEGDDREAILSYVDKLENLDG